MGDSMGKARGGEAERREARCRVWAEDIAKYEISGGEEGHSPEWVETIQVARFLNVGPWELVEGEGGVARETWRDRGLALMRAIQLINQAQQQAARQARAQQQAATGILVPRGVLGA